MFSPKVARRLGALTAATVLLAGCAGGELNSERIQRRYGSYGVLLLAQNASERMTCLYSTEGDLRTCRTIALVLFDRPTDPAFADADRRIRDGASLGATFESLGFRIEKVNLVLGEHLVDSARVGDLMRVATPARLAMHIYRFAAARDGSAIDYATIVELHHPDYLTAAGLERTYGRLASRSLSSTERSTLEAHIDRVLTD